MTRFIREVIPASIIGQEKVNDGEELRKFHEHLRFVGCYYPTDDSVYKVYKVFVDMFIMARLSTPEASRAVVTIADFLIEINGEGALPDVIGCGYKYSGWYAEICLLLISGLITSNAVTFSPTRLLYQLFIDVPVESEEQLKDQLFYYTSDYSEELRQMIAKEIRSASDILTLLDFAFAGRDGSGPFNTTEALPSHLLHRYK